MGKTVIISAARTPFGKFGGVLAPLTAMELGGVAIKEALARAGIAHEIVDDVLMGMALQGGQGQIPSRQAAQHAGLPWEVKTETINKVCASGLRSVTIGDQIIRAGDDEVIVAGGMESMSNVPYVVPNARWGLRMGNSGMVDMMVNDGLMDAYQQVHMGFFGSLTAAEYGISRKDQDAWAYRSHQRAIEAIDKGRMAEEIVPVMVVSQWKGEAIIVDEDEAPRRDTTLEKLAKLRPVFDENGTVTAGNAPGINDGAGAIVLMNGDRARQEGQEPIATIIGHTAIGVPPKDFPKTPGLVINQLLKETGKSIKDIDLFEVNEAFAAVALVGGKITNIDTEKLNVNGGAVALGHPLGASGTRILMTLIYELRRRSGGGLGIAAICSGGGQGDAILVKV